MTKPSDIADIEIRLRLLLADVLHIGSRAETLQSDTPLLGALPELDSVAVTNVILAIEEDFNIHIEDEDVTAETFETFGHLARFIADLHTNKT